MDNFIGLMFELARTERDTKPFGNNLELKPILLDKEYCKKWQENKQDFLHLYKDGVKVSDTLYRKGGFGGKMKDGYIMLLKHVEAFYRKDVLDMCTVKNPNHLKSQWVIIDKDGNEKVEFEQFGSPYLQGGLIYSLENRYYNIETKEFYCTSYMTMKTKDFIFLDNAYDKDVSKRGVMKINKFDGTYELFN